MRGGSEGRKEGRKEGREGGREGGREVPVDDNVVHDDTDDNHL